ncbi:MAG: class II aldolase/adducin family protein [Ignavibacterium sp.]|jgi:ribulose-5-phosphate 4-epimerase/fuculose-1-phosphate aldolase
MNFSLVSDGNDPFRKDITESILKECLRHGHHVSDSSNDIRFVLNSTDAHHPRAGRRRSRSVFIVSLVTADGSVEDMRAFCYTALIRTLSNLLICVRKNGKPTPEVYFTTPEAGFYHYPFDPERVYRSMMPIAGAHYAIENRFETDLPERLWRGSDVVEQIKHYGAELDRLGVLPTPFPLRELLSGHDMRHLYKIYGITGLSYGNLSARERIPELGETTFWMTGRGIDKSHISTVGRDVLLVRDFDHAAGTAILSMPREYDPRTRVSVDAVEHALIYKTYPAVSAIVHVHAWIEGVLCTRQNYPCGTQELAEEVVALLEKTGSPERTVVGLKNHGLTITGPSLEEIFERIRGRLLPEVPMFA